MTRSEAGGPAPGSGPCPQEAARGAAPPLPPPEPAAAASRPPAAWRQPPKYLAVAGIRARTVWAYAADQLLRTLFLVAVIFVFVQLWRTTYGALGRTAIDGYNLRQMIWYLVLSEALFMSLPATSEEIDREVRSGELACRLTKPAAYVLYHVGGALGEGAARFALNLPVAAAVAWISVGPLRPTAGGLLGLAMAGGLALVLNGLLCTGIGLLAFWLEDTRPISFLYSRLMLVLGGTVLPLDLFPPALRSALAWSPLQLVVYGPARICVRFTPAAFGGLLWHQALWIASAAALAAVIYRLGVRSVAVHGG